MNEVHRLVEAAAAAGESIALDALGGEEAIYGDGDMLARSAVFGDVAEILAREWTRLRNPSHAEQFVALGLREQADRLVLGHAVDAIAQAPLENVRAIVMALDEHARNRGANDFVRTEAAAGVVRIALREHQWRATASALLVVLEEIQDQSALAEVARLAALTWEHFRDSEMILLLERHADNAQAAYERGVIGVALALESDAFENVPLRMQEAQRWLRRSTEGDEDRRDARMYLLLAEALEAISSAKPTPPDLGTALREQAVMRYRWDAPRAGAEWLFPPHEAELQWIPLVDQIIHASQHLTEPSWLEASLVLGETVKTYLATRAIRPGLAGVERVLQPAIETAFIRERGLLAHLEAWIDSGGASDFATHDINRLKKNIEARRSRESGKV